MLFGQGRKRQFEYKKLESIHMKQQAVLKRKTEEVSSTWTPTTGVDPRVTKVFTHSQPLWMW